MAPLWPTHNHPIKIKGGQPLKILGLDMASKTGWGVVIARGQLMESGVQDFTKKRGESNGLMFLRFRKWLRDFCDLLNPDLIAYEQAHFRGGAATEICVGLQTRAQEIAAERGIESAPVKTNTLKKWATGKGNAGKEEMITAAGKFMHRPPIDDNEADAVLVSLWAANEFG